MTTPAPALPIDAATSSTLQEFASAVRSSPHNLLSRRALEVLEDRHIAEGIGVAVVVPAGARTVLDVGSGGGFPGMVLAIVRQDLEVTLLDATAKKVAFLADTASALGVDVRTMRGRSEELIRTTQARFDIVTARAVAPLGTLLSWTLPWCRPGGHVLAIKGEQWEDEVRDALPTLRATGASVEDVVSPGAVVSTGSDGAPDGVIPRIVIIRAPG